MSELSLLENLPTPPAGIPEAALLTPSHHTEPWWNLQNLRLQLKRVLASIACTATVGMIPSDAEVTLPHTPPAVRIIHEDGVCPPDSQFLVLNVGGIGMRSVGLNSAFRTEGILGDEFDECNAALDPGTNYDIAGNMYALREVREKTDLDTIVFFAHSFGAIATADMINAYREWFPDDKVKFAAVLFSSPGITDDLRPTDWAAAHFASSVRVNQDFMRAAQYAGLWLQGQDLSDKQVLADFDFNVKDTPSTLIHDDTKRMREGISKLPEDDNIPMYYIADLRDSVVDVVEAPQTIERLTGKKFAKIIYIAFTHDQLGYHAPLWRHESSEDFKPVLKEQILPDVLKRLGTNVVKPQLFIDIPTYKFYPKSILRPYVWNFDR